MLRVTVEVFPGGSAARKKVVAQADVANISDLADRSDYVVDVKTAAWLQPAWERRGMIMRHDRRQTVWALVGKVAAWATVEADKP